ncbi:MAG: hypothetical protein NZ889_01550 [Candidatus Pacearchaeota archaeon]|nr:hypothetical protein [Candidatus Pacearchaeota archaeon]
MKKAQEEIMGFLMIVVIIIIVGLVFLSFSLSRGKKSIEAQTMQADDLLFAMLLYSSNCKIKNEFLNVRELIKECNTYNPICENENKNACEKLNETLAILLEKTLGTKIENAFVHGYFIEINGTKNIRIEKGNLTGNYFGTFVAIPVGFDSNVEIKLKIFYS